MDRVMLATDGGCRRNPGPGAIAAALFDESGAEIDCDGVIIGKTTNNRAEYHALLLGLELCERYTRGRVSCYSDSELLVRQLNGEYKVRAKALRPLFAEVQERAKLFEQVTYIHVRRDDPRIQRVDGIANNLLDAQSR